MPILATKQLREVKNELPYFTKWKELGEKLGLPVGLLEVIEADHKRDGVLEHLDKMLQHWLNQNYDTDQYGLPTWSGLAEAVHPIDPALASKIKENHC